MPFYEGEASRGSQRKGGWRGQDRHGDGLGLGRPDNPTPSRPQPLGLVLDSIDIRNLLVEEDALTIQNAEYVASYNWLNCKSSIILVLNIETNQRGTKACKIENRPLQKREEHQNRYFLKITPNLDTTSLSLQNSVIR